MPETIDFVLNGEKQSLEVDGARELLWVLRHELGATGVKYGCGIGLCGSCTVLVDGRAVRACHTPVREVAGKEVVTIEGLASGKMLHPVQQAFMDHDALQCGYCTPGMILQAAAFLGDNPKPTRDEIIGAMENNLCRCGAHSRIIQAIEAAALQMQEGR